MMEYESKSPIASPEDSERRAARQAAERMELMDDEHFAVAAAPAGPASPVESDQRGLVDNDKLGPESAEAAAERLAADSPVESSEYPVGTHKRKGSKLFAKFGKSVTSIFRKKKSLKEDLERKEIKDKPVHSFGQPTDSFQIKKLIKDAQLGDREAQFVLGYCYDVGAAECKVNTEDAMHYYHLAAMAGHAVAANNLGVIYSTGHRGKMRSNWAEALHWYEKAAALGNCNAQFHMGLAYMNGDGIEKSDAHAFFWFKKAAKQGHTIAQSNIGAMYMAGRGTELNYKKAVKWLRKAVMKRDAVAAHNLAVMYHKGIGVLPDDKQAEEYFEIALRGKNAGLIPKELSAASKSAGTTLYNS